MNFISEHKNEFNKINLRKPFFDQNLPGTVRNLGKCSAIFSLKEQNMLKKPLGWQKKGKNKPTTLKLEPQMAVILVGHMSQFIARESSRFFARQLYAIINGLTDLAANHQTNSGQQ